MKALLIIDMQKGCFNPYSSKYNTNIVIENINKLSDQFRKSLHLIIYIVHDGTKENYLFPNTPDFEILPELKRDTTDKLIVKEANDPFYKTNLDLLLQEHSVDELYICGQATNFCIDCTIKVALNKDYNITIASDAHTTKATEGIDAKKIIEYYNWLWKNLTPTKYPIRVESTSKIIASLLE